MTVKLIKHTSECDHPDDPSVPFKLEMVLRVPDFMAVTWAALYGGTEEIVARGDSVEELHAWMEENGLKTHPRRSRYAITNSDGVVVDSFDRFKKDKERWRLTRARVKVVTMFTSGAVTKLVLERLQSSSNRWSKSALSVSIATHQALSPN